MRCLSPKEFAVRGRVVVRLTAGCVDAVGRYLYLNKCTSTIEMALELVVLT